MNRFAPALRARSFSASEVFFPQIKINCVSSKTPIDLQHHLGALSAE